ncbi:MAG: helix-turn-helix transcriptional regulator [Oscillospiraceae bacterium]|nr:helix-turn-helix transcriptional regulator [Oscillospiraceae bacterium]
MGKDTFLINMGVRIAQQRKELKLTQEQLAEKMGVSLQTISCIELGKKAVRPENLANLCSYLNISSDYILYGKRDSQQMTDVITKLSNLKPEEYQAVQTLIELLYKEK